MGAKTENTRPDHNASNADLRFMRAGAGACRTTAPALTVAEPHGRLRSCRRRGDHRRGSGYREAPALPHAEVEALARGGRQGAARRNGLRHARALQPSRPHRPLRRGADRRRASPRSSTPWPIRTGRLRGRRGAPRLLTAGIRTRGGNVCEGEAKASSTAVWIAFGSDTDVPHVIAKFAAMTLDGRIATSAPATASGSPAPISRADAAIDLRSRSRRDHRRRGIQSSRTIRR